MHNRARPSTTGHAPTAAAKPAYARRWDRARASLQDAIRLAREDPAEAQARYNLFAAGCRDPLSIDRLLDTFDELGILTAALSHKHHLCTHCRDVEYMTAYVTAWRFQQDCLSGVT
ncbi:MAG: hypothetical protein ACLP01_26870 [Solirubrobacteraceae bacterium]